ncbi:14263_t:CDS:2, partial [Ambispora leptoticha]
SEITQLESNPAKNQAELESKKKRLKELQDQEKQLTASLPLNTQITILQKEIKQLESKSTRTKVEEVLLSEKKKELEELLKKQNNSDTNNAKPTDKTALVIGCGVVATILIFDGVCKRDSDLENKGKTREEITKLDISKGKIGNNYFKEGKNLVGSLRLEGFTNLRTLICFGHQLIGLDVSNCSNLENLDCRDNELNSLNTTGCLNLKTIDCSSNHIRELDLSACPSLKEVEISNGKSTLANVLTDTNQFVEKKCGASITKHFQKIEEDILFKIGEGIHAAKEGINQVLFVAKGRFSDEQVIAFDTFKDFIAESGITRFTTIVKTGFKDFSNSQECARDRQSLLVQAKKIRKIIESCNDIIHVNNPAIPELDEEGSDNEQEIIITKKKRKASREKKKEIEQSNIIGGVTASVEYNAQKKKHSPNQTYPQKTGISLLNSQDMDIESETVTQNKRPLSISSQTELSREEIKLPKTSETQETQSELMENLYLKKNMTKTIILIGRTGSGKSTLANVISGTNKFKESGASISETKDIQSEEFEENNIGYRIIDTVGIGDTKLTKEEVLDKIAEAIYLAREGKEKCKEDIDLMLAKGDRLAEIIDSCQGKVVHVNNPPIEIKENLQESCQSFYNPPKLKELSAEIISYMENKLELKKRLKHEKLEIIESKRKIKENISAEVNKISLISREEMDNIQELNAKGENNDSSKEKITKLKNSIEKLKKEIQEKEEIIRKKVLDSVFNNYKSIIGVPGGDIFIGKVLGEEFIVKELVDDWMERRFSLEET